MFTSSISPTRRRTNPAQETTNGHVLGVFTFELKFRFKSISTYIYFLVWVVFSFLDVASENFGPIGITTERSC